MEDTTEAFPQSGTTPGQIRPSSTITQREVHLIFLYFALLALLLGVGDGLALLPVTFFLKEKLHLGPQQMATYGAITAFPSYVGFVFGFLRDRWRPFGKGDRGYMMLSMPAIACLNFYLSLEPLTYTRILWVSLAGGIIGNMLGTAISSLKISVAQKWLMTGRLVALGGMVGVVPGVLSSLTGGWLTHHATPQFVFRICAILYFVVTGMSFWCPKAVFDGQPEQRPAIRESNAAAIRRMFSHRPFWPAMTIMLLYTFAPGWGTPLFFYLTDAVKISPEQYGVINASGIAVVAVVSMFYGFLCRRIPLKRLLWLGAILGTIGGPAYLLIHNFAQAIAVSILVSSLLGVAYAAFSDLLMRSFPMGLEGTGSAMVESVEAIIFAGGDIFGSWLYERGGFGLALVITTISTALILPMLLLIPNRLVATRDGETQENATSFPPPVSSG